MPTRVTRARPEGPDRNPEPTTQRTGTLRCSLGVAGLFGLTAGTGSTY